MARIKGTIKKASGIYLDTVSNCLISKNRALVPDGWEVREAGAHPACAPLAIGSTLGEAVKLARGEVEEE